MHHNIVADYLPVCCAASTSMTVLVLPSGPKVQTSFCTATLLVGGRRPLGDWQIPNCCWIKKEEKFHLHDHLTKWRWWVIFWDINVVHHNGHYAVPLTEHSVGPCLSPSDWPSHTVAPGAAVFHWHLWRLDWPLQLAWVLHMHQGRAGRSPSQVGREQA